VISPEPDSSGASVVVVIGGVGFAGRVVVVIGASGIGGLGTQDSVHPHETASSKVYSISVPFLHFIVTTLTSTDVGLQQEHELSDP
jgi:hypothetical protein